MEIRAPVLGYVLEKLRDIRHSRPRPVLPNQIPTLRRRVDSASARHLLRFGPMEAELKGKGVLVTGGAGGIGRAICRAFAAEGARVGVHYFTSEQGARELAGQVGGTALQANLTEEREADSLIPAAAEALGRLDVLVANAGAWAEHGQPLWDISIERWRDTIASCLDSVFLSCRAFLRHVASTGTGNIVLVGSTAGLIGEAGFSDYAAAKGALSSGLLLSLKNEIVRIAPQGRVNLVAPGWTDTASVDDDLSDPEVRKRILATIPLNKVATVEDVANAIVFLASDHLSGDITGQVLTVGGGIEGRIQHP
jgi:3-oxoacyl-[acyl-carrier protein] reductase